MFICNLIAQYKSNSEIDTLLKEQHGVGIGSGGILSIKKKHGAYIEKLRAKYLNDMLDVPIAQEKVRLERDEKLYELSQTLANPEDKISKGLLCLKEAREETKKIEHQANFIQFNQYNTLTDEELISKKKELERKIINIKAEVVSG